MAPQYVLFVPGFGGNELYLPANQFVPASPVWLNYGFLAAGFWRAMQLNPAGTGPVGPLDRALAAGLAVPEYYAAVSDYLANAGYVPISHDTDWRGKLAGYGFILASHIRVLGRDRPVHILAHSRGGLLLRYALAEFTPQERADLVGRIVGIGVPHYGTWSAALALAGYGPIGAGMAALLYGVQSLTTPIFYSKSIGEVQNSWPGLYQLLPAPGAPGITPEEIAGVYNPANWAGSPWPISATHLAAALNQWASVPPVPSDVDWLHIVGAGTATAHDLLMPSQPWSKGSYRWSTQGDGTVPLIWATWPAGRYFVSGDDHTSMPQAGDVMRQMLTWFGPL